MYPRRKIAQGHQTVSVSVACLTDPASDQLQSCPESEMNENCSEMNKGPLSVLCSFAPAWRMSLCNCVCQLSPFAAEPPLSPEKGVKREKGREIGQDGEGGGTLGTGEGGGGRDRKREAGRGVRSILFSYVLLWKERWARGEPTSGEWALYVGKRESQGPEPIILRCSALRSELSPGLRLHTKAELLPSAAGGHLRCLNGR